MTFKYILLIGSTLFLNQVIIQGTKDTKPPKITQNIAVEPILCDFEEHIQPIARQSDFKETTVDKIISKTEFDNRKKEEQAKKEAEQKQIAEQKKQAEKLITEERNEEQVNLSESEDTQTPKVSENAQPRTVATQDGLSFDENGLLREEKTENAQLVINGLLGIPGHSNGQSYHNNGLDEQISRLSTLEAVAVIHAIEGAGFGQTGDGYAGLDTPESHRIFVENQVNRRFGGSVHNLLYAWGTYSYGGY